MKGKKLSKVLAILLAVVMIFTTLPLMAFASTETYTVSFGAPAIPMNVNTKVDLKTLKVEIVKGATAVSGADITWAAAAQDGLTLDVAKKTVEVTAVGNYKLTATVGETTKNIWVIAKPADQEKIYLVNIPNVWATITGGKWRIFGNKNSTDITVDDALSSSKLLPGKLNDMNFLQMETAFGELASNGKDSNAAATLVYVDEIFEDFSDYTVESYCTAKGANLSDVGAGVGGRVVLNQAGTAYTTGVLSYIRTTSQVSFCRPYNVSNKWGNWGGYGTNANNFTFWATNTEGFFTVKTVLEDSDIMVYVNRGAGAGDEAMLTSTSNHPYTNQAVTAGYPCLTGYGQPARFANFYVYLNSNDMPAPMTGDETDEPEIPTPPVEEVEDYEVSYASPAIPMNEGTAIDLNHINVQMDANGTVAKGTEIVWNAPKQDGLFFNKSTNKVAVHIAGKYKLTATAGGVTKNVWIIAKKATDKKFYLVNIPELNKNTFVYDDWRVFGNLNSTNFVVKDVVGFQGNAAAKIILTNDLVQIQARFGETKEYGGGTLVYVDEIFKDFADYTVETYATAKGDSAATDIGCGASGHFTLNANGTGYITGNLTYIRDNIQVSYNRTYTDFGGIGTAKDTAAPYDFYGALEKWHTFKNVYEGGKVTFYYDNNTEPLIDSSVKSDFPAATTGYPGITGYGAPAQFKSFSVYLNSDELAPTITNVYYDAYNMKVAVNTVFDLANIGLNFDNEIIPGNKANIDNVRDINGEVSNGQFVAFSVGTVTVTANYQGKTTVFTIKVVDDGSENVDATQIADKTVVIEPVISSATDSAYNVTVKPEQGKSLAALGLGIYEKDQKITSYQCVDSTGKKFRFETLGIEKVTIKTEYTDEDAVSVAPLGATIRLPDTAKGVKTGIKFGNRINIVKNDGTAVKLKDTANIEIGDTLIENVTIKEIGTLVVPTALVGDELLYTNPNAIKKKATSVSATTASHSDITAVLVDIPEDQYDLSISARAYVAYTLEDDDDVYYYYGDVIERTYNDVYTTAAPARHYYNEETGLYGELIVDDGTIQDNTEKTIKVEQLLDGGTDHYLDSITQTDDISYVTGETITYAFRIKGNYKLRYTVKKDNAADNLYGNETRQDTTVKSGTYGGDVFKFSTQMKKAGAVYVQLEVLDTADKLVATFKHTIIADLEKVKPAVESPTYYYDKNGNKVNSTVAEFYEACKDEWAPMLEKIRAEVNSTAFKNYWSKKEANAVYDGTYIYATRKSDVNGYYLYDIQIATEEPSKVVAGATKVKDTFATTANNKFLYNDYNVRPSSFNLTLHHNATAGSLGVTAALHGYDQAKSADKTTSNSLLYVNMNSHGILNNQNATYYTEIHKVNSALGGTKSFGFNHNPNGGTGVEKSPTELYFYGIIKRDYFGLQFAKMLPEYNTESVNTITGGSMGAFRSVLAAAFDSSFKTVNASYSWMGGLGGRENGKVYGAFMPANTIGIQYFSTVHAAATLGTDVTLNLRGNGLGDYTSPPSGIVALYNAAICKKSLEFRQYREHGNTMRTINHYDMTRSANAISMPTGLDGTVMSESEMLNAYRGYTDWRVDSILENKNEISPATGGTAYYISNNGKSTNNGLTTSTPLATLDDLTKIESKLKAGDVVYFERGSVFRGSYTVNVDGVKYAAYGNGPKPEIYASLGDAATEGTWVQTAENKNVYVYTDGKKYESDIGNIVFNGGEQHGIKCIIRTEDDGTYNNTTGKKFDSYADLDENLHFYHDEDTKKLYLYCDYGNPGDVFESIEICVGKFIFSIKANNVQIDNLCFKYTGAHAISATGQRANLTVTNCAFEWIGGSIQQGVDYTDYPPRFGNGVEIWGACNGFNVNNCYFGQIYDAAVTFQYTNATKTDYIMQNIDISDNVIEYSNYSFEYFLDVPDVGTGSYIKDVNVDNNLMWYAGYGFCEQRPDKEGAAHVKAWKHSNYLKGTFTITNNLFALSKADLVQSNADDASHSPTYSENVYIQYTDGYLGTSRDILSKVLFDNSVRAEINNLLGDSKPTIIYVTK